MQAFLFYMGTTHKQDQDFLSDVLGFGLLESSIEWISQNLNPIDVFKEDVLQDWAKSNDFIDIHNQSELETWAEKNGYIKE